MASFCVSTILSPEQKEIAIATWYSLGMQGCEENSVDSGVEVKIYFPDRNTAQIASEDLKNRNPLSPVLIRQIENEDWNRKWRESMKPAELAPGYWVSPLWLPPPMQKEDVWIKIEPKMAFGTGHHETTRLAAREILNRKEWLSGKSVLDIGTGSGVLCFVADQCGATNCTGVEIDKDCQENLAENHTLNSAKGRINFLIGSLSALKNSSTFDMIVMNMIMTESEPLLSRISQLITAEGILVWSGILSKENNEAVTSACDFGFKLLGQQTENEWWCGSFIKKS